jgi:long-chain fatty acid transport protein
MRGKVTSLHLAGVMVAAALAGTTTARGAGFALYEMSARGNALGGTLVGITGDASAAYFNPANMTANAGVQMMAGASAIGPKTDVKTTVPTPMGPAQLTSESKTRWWTPPHAYATMQASEKAWIGLAIYSPFGLGSVFDSDWPGRYNSYRAIIETVDVNPNVAYKVDEKLSVAVGLQIMTFDLELKRKLPNAVVPGGPDMDFELKGDSVGLPGQRETGPRPGLPFRSRPERRGRREPDGHGPQDGDPRRRRPDASGRDDFRCELQGRQAHARPRRHLHGMELL